MDEISLLKYLPNAIEVVVILIGIRYIKYLHSNHKADKAALVQSHKETVDVLMASHKEERTRFETILERANTTNKELSDSHRSLMHQQLQVSGEMTVAIKSLEIAVNNLQKKA